MPTFWKKLELILVEISKNQQRFLGLSVFLESELDQFSLIQQTWLYHYTDILEKARVNISSISLVELVDLQFKLLPNQRVPRLLALLQFPHQCNCYSHSGF
jgi:hypothetical protein